MKISKPRQLFLKARKTVKNNAPMILSCIGTAGTVATVVLTAKATFKAADVIKELEEEKETVELADKIKQVGPYYIPAATTCLITVMCIFGAEILNKKRQMSIAGAYMAVDRMLKEYKQKVSDIGGEELTKKIEKQIVEEKLKNKDISVEGGKKLYYEEYYGEYFEAKPEDVLKAIYELNRTLQYMCEATLDDFYDMLGIKTDIGLGWSADYINYDWECAYWIDMYTEDVVLDDGLECSIIHFPLPPIANYLDYGEYLINN